MVFRRLASLRLVPPEWECAGLIWRLVATTIRSAAPQSTSQCHFWLATFPRGGAQCMRPQIDGQCRQLWHVMYIPIAGAANTVWLNSGHSSNSAIVSATGYLAIR